MEVDGKRQRKRQQRAGLYVQLRYQVLLVKVVQLDVCARARASILRSLSRNLFDDEYVDLIFHYLP